MPPLTDKDQIRAILRRNPRWCVYALGDLTPRMFEKCQWFTPDLTMVLHDYGTSILFAHGTGSIREALDHVTWPVHLQVQPDALDEVARYATVTNEKHDDPHGVGRRIDQGERSRDAARRHGCDRDRTAVCRRRINRRVAGFFLCVDGDRWRVLWCATSATS